MAGGVIGAILAVDQAGGVFRGKVLVQGAAQGRVEKLQAAADAQDGLAPPAHQRQKCRLHFVPLRQRGPQRGSTSAP